MELKLVGPQEQRQLVAIMKFEENFEDIKLLVDSNE